VPTHPTATAASFSDAELADGALPASASACLSTCCPSIDQQQITWICSKLRKGNYTRSKYSIDDDDDDDETVQGISQLALSWTSSCLSAAEDEDEDEVSR